MIVTLAGHVDHGKTTLVQALTGVDTDRLAEEKARGLTIDLGFAYTAELGFVDVPGHQKFIHNMVAGVAAEQHALMVIAADDGPMPQSQEHLEILTLIGVKSGTIALTKCDLVSPERLAECHAEIQELTHKTPLQGAPVFPTSAKDSSSYIALGEHLREAALRHQPKVDSSRFRLAIDRAFTVKGAGVVVTGTVHSGAISTGQQIHHFPSGKALRVRSMRVEDQPAERTRVGDRCALNLVGASLNELKRGDWISDHALAGHHSITIRLDKASSFSRAIKHWMPVHVYHATSHSTARLALFTRAADDECWAEIICDTPMACRRGDRLVLRDQALDATLGGGEVLYVSTFQTRRRNSAEHCNLVAAYSAGDAALSFEQLMQRFCLKDREFQTIWNLTDSAINTLKSSKPSAVVGELSISEDQWLSVQAQCLQAIGEGQSVTRDMASGDKTSRDSAQGLKAQDLNTVPAALRQPALSSLLKAGKILQQGGAYRLAKLAPALPDELLALWQQVEPLLDHMQAPSSGDLAKTLEMNLPLLEKQLMRLVKHGNLTFLGNHRFYLPRRLQEIAAVVERMAKEHPQGTMNVKAFRDTTGIGRNVAIEVLEFFDGKGFTRRQGNERVVLRAFEKT